MRHVWPRNGAINRPLTEAVLFELCLSPGGPDLVELESVQKARRCDGAHNRLTATDRGAAGTRNNTQYQLSTEYLYTQLCQF